MRSLNHNGKKYCHDESGPAKKEKSRAIFLVRKIIKRSYPTEAPECHTSRKLMRRSLCLCVWPSICFAFKYSIDSSISSDRIWIVSTSGYHLVVQIVFVKTLPEITSIKVILFIIIHYHLLPIQLFLLMLNNKRKIISHCRLPRSVASLIRESGLCLLLADGCRLPGSLDGNMQCHL